MANVAHVFMWACLANAYFIWRYNIDIRRMKRLSLSKTGVFVLLLIIGGVVALYSIQSHTGKWLYSTANLETVFEKEIPLTTNEDVIDIEGTGTNVTRELFVDYGRIFHLVFAAPMIEEIVLRIGLTTVIQRRLQTVVSSIVWTNIIFSSLHVVNALQEASSSYTLFQVFAGFVLGTFYSTRLYITGNVLESFVLHVMNNLAAIWIPMSLTWKDIVPDFIIPLVVTQIIYIVLLVRDLKYISKAHAVIQQQTTQEEQVVTPITVSTIVDQQAEQEKQKKD
jgi:membrane protease YdiL (CAAX protease family)